MYIFCHQPLKPSFRYPTHKSSLLFSYTCPNLYWFHTYGRVLTRFRVYIARRSDMKILFPHIIYSNVSQQLFLAHQNSNQCSIKQIFLRVMWIVIFFVGFRFALLEDTLESDTVNMLCMHIHGCPYRPCTRLSGHVQSPDKQLTLHLIWWFLEKRVWLYMTPGIIKQHKTHNSTMITGLALTGKILTIKYCPMESLIISL